MVCVVDGDGAAFTEEFQPHHAVYGLVLGGRYRLVAEFLGGKVHAVHLQAGHIGTYVACLNHLPDKPFHLLWGKLRVLAADMLLHKGLGLRLEFLVHHGAVHGVVGKATVKAQVQCPSVFRVLYLEHRDVTLVVVGDGNDCTGFRVGGGVCLLHRDSLVGGAGDHQSQ